MIKFIYMLKIRMKQNINLLINKSKGADLQYLNGSKLFIEYLNDIDDIYKNITFCLMLPVIQECYLFQSYCCCC